MARQAHRILPALVVSILVHGAVVWWIVGQEQPGRAPVRLEVVLMVPSAAPESKAAPADEPVAAADPPALSTPSVREPPVERPPEPRVAPDPSPPRVVLNLERPAEWDDLVAGEAGSDAPGQWAPRLPFNAALEAALDTGIAEQRRRVLVAERSAAAYGVADEAYARDGALGTQLKRDGHCLTLVEDRAVERGARWWAGTCTETRRSPFTLRPVEYDRLGRMVAD
ncbi:MAG: hypothetical protein AB7I04_13270 [Pseudomonadales bacterium]